MHLLHSQSDYKISKVNTCIEYFVVPPPLKLAAVKRPVKEPLLTCYRSSNFTCFHTHHTNRCRKVNLFYDVTTLTLH